MNVAAIVGDLVAACFLAAVGIGLLISEDPGRKSIGFLLDSVVSAMLMLVLDSVMLFSNYPQFDVWIRGVVLSAHFLFSYFAVMFFHFYVCSGIEEGGGKVGRWVRPATVALCVLAGAAWLIALPSGTFYVLGSDGVDAPTDQMLYIQIPVAFILALDLVLAQLNTAALGKRVAISLYVSFAACAGAYMLRDYFGSMPLNVIAALFLVVCYIMNALEQNRRMLDQEARLAQSRLDVAMSQIQPHFLYNSLNSIYHLIDIDPERAQEVLSQFSTYLRMNLKAVGESGRVPFSTELEHISTYLLLEKLRFGDDLNVEIQADATDFDLPPLSVQPLVENAVKHGVCKKEEGGTVRVCSRELEDAWEITVSDDGVGFDAEAVQHGAAIMDDVTKRESGAGIGLSNVSHRLKRLSNATLWIQSTPGQGTIATVTIPKGDKQ